MQKNNFFILAFLLLVSSCSSPQTPREKKYPIEIGQVVQKDVPIFIEIIGNIITPQIVVLKPQVGGVILETYVEQGQFVKKGEPLFKIDPRPYEAALEKAKANLIKDTATLSFNKSKLERYDKLVTKEYVSKVDYDLYKSNVETSEGQVQFDKADIETAKLNLEWATPSSPIDGKISQFTIDVGNLVNANDANAITDIRQINPIEVNFNITQKDYLRYQQASKAGPLKVQVFLPEKPEDFREGEIYFVDNHLDLSTGTILIKATIQNKDNFFWPGEFVRVRLLLKTEPKAIMIPEEAIRMGQEGPYIYVYDEANQTAIYRKVVKGETLDHFIVIEKGVNPGEKVVTKGQINLRDKAKVYLSAQNNKKDK